MNKNISFGGKGRSGYGSGAGGVGTVTGAANVGGGYQWFRDLVAGILNFRTLIAGLGVTIVNNGDDFTIKAPAVSAGTGIPLFKPLVGGDTTYRSIIDGGGNTAFNTGDSIQINSVLTNVGVGAGRVGRNVTIGNLNLKTILAGSNITVTDNADDISIAAASPGEVNGGANVGTGAGEVFRDKTGVTLNFKTIKQGAGVTVTNNADDITLSASGGAPVWLDIVYVASSQSNVNAASITLTKPAGTVDGDLILAFVCNVGNTAEYVNAPPAGWVRLPCGPINTEFNSLEVWYKYALSEGANYVFGWTAASDKRGIIVSYRNCMLNNKFTISCSGIVDFNFALNITPPACTVVYPKSVSVVATCNEGNGLWTTVPAGYTSRESVNNLRVSDIAIANTGISTPGNCLVDDNKQRSAVNIILVRKYAYLDSMPVKTFIPAGDMAKDTAGMVLSEQLMNFRTLLAWGMRQSLGDKVTAHLPIPFDWDLNYLGVRLLWSSQNATGYNLVKFQILAYCCGQNEPIGSAGGTYYNNASDYGPTTTQLLRKTPEIWVPVQNAGSVVSPGGERSYFLSIARQPDGYAQTIYLLGAYITYIRKVENTLSPTPFNT